MKNYIRHNLFAILLLVAILGQSIYIYVLSRKVSSLKVEKLESDIAKINLQLNSIDQNETAVKSNLSENGKAAEKSAYKLISKLPVKRKVPDVDYSVKVEYLKNYRK